MTDEKIQDERKKKQTFKQTNTTSIIVAKLQLNWIATKMSVDYPPVVCVRNKSINWHWFCFEHKNSLRRNEHIWYVACDFFFILFLFCSRFLYISFFFCAQHISFRNTIPESIRPNFLAMYFPVWCFDTVDKTSLNWWFTLHSYNNMLKFSNKINKFDISFAFDGRSVGFTTHFVLRIESPVSEPK